jgi:hypothetical protein
MKSIIQQGKLSDEQKMELLKRKDSHLKGFSKSYSWETVEKSFAQKKQTSIHKRNT